MTNIIKNYTQQYLKHIFVRTSQKRILAGTLANIREMEIVLYTYFPIFLICSLLSIELWKILIEKYPKRKPVIFCVLAAFLIILITSTILFNFPMWVGGLPPYLTVFFSIIIISVYSFILTLRKSKKIIIKAILIILIINILSIIWFIPFHIGYKGEVAICKFRLQVYEYDCHDYGTSNIFDNIICYNREKCGKYGCIVFYNKVGKWKEYFGLQELNFEIRE